MLSPPVQRLFRNSRRRVPSSERRWTSVTCASRTACGYIMDRVMSMVHGRCVARRGNEVEILAEGGPLAARGEAEPGDLVEVSGGRARVVARGRPGGEAERILSPRRLRAMAMREGVEDGIRSFFRVRGFREVRTPSLVSCPGLEPHIVPFRVGQ